MLFSNFAMTTTAILLLLCVYGSKGNDLTMDSLNNTLIFIKISTNSAVPFEPMEDDMYFSDPGHKNIKCLKLQNLGANKVDATINAGGVGYHFVNISFKSKPGESLNYLLEIYS